MKLTKIKNPLAVIGGIRTFSSLKNPVYRLYFFGMLGQYASMNMQMVTGSLLIYRLTGSSALLGTLSLANAVPMILMSIFGGAIADRVQKKQVLFVCLFLSSIVSLSIALALTSGFLSKEHEGSWWILMVSSFIQGGIMGLMLPSRQSIIPEIVSREHSLNAVSLNTMGMNTLTLIAPALAGFMIDAFDFKSVYFSMTALYIYGGIIILFIPPTSRVSRSSRNILLDIKDGFQYIQHEKTLFFILGFALIAVVFAMPYRQLLPIFVDNILHVGATGMGILFSVSGIGALAGSLCMASFPNKKRGLLLMISCLISGVALTVFAFSNMWGLSLAVIVFVGLGQTLRGTLSNALLQSYTEERYMGRVMSILMMEWGILSFFTFAAGLIAEVIPVQWVIAGFALVLITLALLAIIFVPRIRQLD
jgi:MFS transporter, DHA1 family, staphyloferrin A biosynthesis exporter